MASEKICTTGILKQQQQQKTGTERNEKELMLGGSGDST